MQRHLAAAAGRDPAAKRDLTALGDSLEGVAETIYARALETTGGTDLRAHLAYAEHLIFRDQPDKGREVAAKALKLPIASMTAWEATAAGLRETAVKAALGKADDPRAVRQGRAVHQGSLRQREPSVRRHGALLPRAWWPWSARA